MHLISSGTKRYLWMSPCTHQTSTYSAYSNAPGWSTVWWTRVCIQLESTIAWRAPPLHLTGMHYACPGLCKGFGCLATWNIQVATPFPAPFTDTFSTSALVLEPGLIGNPLVATPPGGHLPVSTQLWGLPACDNGNIPLSWPGVTQQTVQGPLCWAAESPPAWGQAVVTWLWGRAGGYEDQPHLTPCSRATNHTLPHTSMKKLIYPTTLQLLYCNLYRYVWNCFKLSWHYLAQLKTRKSTHLEQLPEQKQKQSLF